MSDRTDALAQVLFNKSSLQECSLQQVDYLAHQYPYFSTAQLLLLQKTEPGSEAYTRQLQRTALHFSNPLQLQAWLQPALFETEIPEAELFQNPIPDQEVATAAPDEVTEAEEHALEEAIAEPAPASEAPSTPVSPETAAQPETSITEKPAAPVVPAITFEPFHTVDYFASQGIKLSQQETTNDTLGKQMKSFTEWLKTMKRLPEAAVTRNTDAAGERKVEHLAQHSLDKADVVTESMAEVWLKQGNKEKAIELYNKLSLRYPAKSAYFAAKIESLKQS